MAFRDEYEFDLLKNEAENMVLTELEEQLASYPGVICRCNECVVDMAAISLNSIKPLYRFSLLGTLYAVQTINEEDYRKGIEEAVFRAIEKVRRNPAHD
ncbi:MAG: late competence development ComFB family protein [Treponema sp.]|jgi:competence protein ComFB|nr:late competence development ComFB family protein [Treponema sp.]